MVDVFARGEGHAARIELRPGGSAANAGLHAAACGADATVVGRVGRDFAGAALRRALEEGGVRAMLAEDEAAATGTFLRLEEGVRVDRGANARFSAADVPEHLAADAVLVSGYLLLHGDSNEGAAAALARAEAEWIALDTASAPLLEAFRPERFLDAAGPANVLLANREEARVLADADGEEAARVLAERFRLACVKLGDAGAVAVLDGEAASARAPHVERATETGAGDAFAAALLVALTRRTSLPDALEEACRRGALAVSAI